MRLRHSGQVLQRRIKDNHQAEEQDQLGCVEPAPLRIRRIRVSGSLLANTQFPLRVDFAFGRQELAIESAAAFAAAIAPQATPALE